MRPNEIREKYQSLNSKVELLSKWRRNQVNEQEKEAAWQILSDICFSRAKSHYKRMNPFDALPVAEHEDVNIERICHLAEFIRSNRWKTVNWCVSTWKFRFSEVEMELELSRKGVTDKLSRKQLNTCILVKQYMSDTGDEGLYGFMKHWVKAHPNAKFETIQRVEKEAAKAIVILQFLKRTQFYEK